MIRRKRNSGDQLLSVKDAADRLNVSETTIRRWISSGEIEPVRVGRKLLRFRPEELDRLLTGSAA